MKHITSKLAISIRSIFCQVNMKLFSIMIKKFLIVEKQLLIIDTRFFPELIKSKY